MRFTGSLLLILLALLVVCLWKFSSPTQASPFSKIGPSSVRDEEITKQGDTLHEASSQIAPPADLVQRLELPVPDLNPIVADARLRDRKKLPFRFATPLDVNKTTSDLSPWSITDGLATWELQIHAPNALSLNFAFDQFHMPPGGILSLQSSESDEVITFTSRDNDDHGELWTPLFRGDSVRLTASLPAVLLSDLRLRLAKVNYGFRDKRSSGKIGGSISGNCNVDVVCDGLDGTFAEMIDSYREQIRSVAAYTLNGIDTCSGALINNSDLDNTPYFLTAAHCDITTANDSSIVLYWNFENSTCRIPGTNASGGLGDGDLTVFNSGSTLRAASGSSDFCLIELDDPVNPGSEAFFAGWDRSSTPPTEAIGIHHPAVAEKRISFEFNPLSTTNYYGSTITSAGTHLRVLDWDVGTTEGGSSGSPLFNASGQIVGQLHGGDAACGNNDPDWYGRVFTSWTGGGTPSTRLSNWLAPSGTAPLSLSGLELNTRIQADDIAVTEGDSGSQTATVTIELSSETSSPVTFTLTPSGGTASPGSDYIDPGPQTATITPPQTSTTIDIIINGDNDPEENETILLSFSNVTGAQSPSQPTTIVIANDEFITPEITSSLSENGNEGTVFGYLIEADNTPTSYALAGQPAGMTVDSTSGLITWDTPSTGTYTFTISATNPAGTGSETFSLSIAESLLKPAFEVPSEVVIGGDASQWSITTTDTFDGEDALTLSSASDSSDTELTCTVQGPDELTFWWKASTEYTFDVFNLTLDSTVVAAISGETGWHSHSLTIPAGNHTVGFQYLRDSSIDGGFNQVWLDRFTLKSLSMPAFEQPTDLFVELGTETSLNLSTAYESDLSSIDSLPSDWAILDGNHISGLFESAFSFSATAENEQGSSTRNFSLSPFSSTSSLQSALDQSILPVRSDVPAFFSQSQIRTTGTAATRSGSIGGDDRSEMTATVMGPGTLSFDWRAFSEEGFDYGYVLLDGKQIAVTSGNSGWIEVVQPLTAGLHEVTWLYVKDETVDELTDAIYVDNVRLEGYAQWVLENEMSPFSLPIGSGVDGDQNPALVEYAVGLSPANSEAPHLLELTGSPGAWNLSTPVNASALNLTLSIEKSLSLLPDTWNPIGSDSSPLSSTLSAPDSSADAKAFYRLHATSP
ncbi:MAG: trypsin-like peptidase domain-containing protein [Roseibacillus sp.]